MDRLVLDTLLMGLHTQADVTVVTKSGQTFDAVAHRWSLGEHADVLCMEEKSTMVLIPFTSIDCIIADSTIANAVPIGHPQRVD
jgi:hypothetical protein